MPSRNRLFLVLALWPIAAFAYIDPGSGMLLVQGVIALIGAIIVFIKNPFRTIKHLYHRIFKGRPS